MTIPEKKRDSNMWYTAMPILMVVLVLLSAALGAWGECVISGGRMTSKVQCIELTNVGICEMNDRMYIAPGQNMSNWTFTKGFGG